MAMISEPIKIDRPRDVPSPPVGPVVFSNINKTSATMSFKKSKSDGYSPITHYIVDIREKFKRTYTHMTDIRADQELTCELTNLTEGQEYQVQVRSVNSVGTSKPLESDNTVKPKSPYSPPSAPRNVKTSDITTSGGLLDWKVPEKDGGAPISKYYVEKREKTYGSWKPEGTVEAPTTTLELKRLQEGVEYYFKVCAENEAGKGPFSDMVGPAKPEKEKSEYKICAL
jgi:titin